MYTGVTSRTSYSVPKHPQDMLNISLSLSLDLPMKEREARVGLVVVEEGGRREGHTSESSVKNI